MTEQEQVHGTAIAIQGHGVLLLGPAGSGKSDLALRLIDRGARLIADDQVVLTVAGPRLQLSSPGPMIGLLEVRGVGLCAAPQVQGAALRLAVRCDLPVERLPHPGTHPWLGIAVPLLRLAPWEASAPIKLEWALRAVVDGTTGTSKERADP